METKKKSLFASAMQYGLILGAIFIVITLLYYVLEINMFSLLFGVLGFIVNLAIVIILYVIGIKSFREKSLGGNITYGQSFLTGTIIGLFGFIISAVFSFIFYKYFEPDLLMQNAERALDVFADKGVSGEQLDMMEKRFMKGANPDSQLKSGLIGGVVFAVILSLIISIFIKKEKVSDTEIQ